MGYLANGVCYATYDEAASVHFANHTFVPAVDRFFLAYKSGSAWIVQVSHQVGGSWALDYSLVYPVIPFPNCTPSVSVFDPVLAGALWSFALTVIIGLWFLAKNAGMILQMIRRW